MGVDDARPGLADDGRQAPGADDVEGAAERQCHYGEARLLVLTADGLDGFRHDGHVVAVFTLSPGQVVDVLLAASPLLVRYDMENLHAAKVRIFSDISTHGRKFFCFFWRYV